MERNGGRGAVGEKSTQDNDRSEVMGRVLVMVRRELQDAELEDRMAVFESRAESIYRSIVAKYELEQQRGTWTTRLSRWVTTMAAALWNSRAVRLLVP
jgi:hypothetical protein